jgi:hypothetical protein
MDRIASRAVLCVLACVTTLLVMLAITSAASAAFVAPLVQFQTSTNQATAHPDAQLTIVNPPGNDDIRALKLSLPDGFWGSLNAATKCTFVAGTGATGSDNCTNSSKVGTVHASALVDNSTVRLTGDVYLTNAFVGTDIAGIGIKVQGAVGGIDLGYVRVAARALERGNAQGIDTIAENLPNMIDDSARGHGVTNFHLSRMVIDLKSNLSSPFPLLTNPSSCPVSPAQVTAVFNSATTLGVGNVPSTPVPYPVTGCANVQFNPTITLTPSSVAAGTTSGLTSEVTLPADNATLKQVTVALPHFGANFPSFGDAADQCPSSSWPTVSSVFDPSNCPAQAKVGTVTLTTPLLPSQVHGYVYLINKSPLPFLGIDINPSIPGNTEQVTLRVAGTTSTPQMDSSCTAAFCQAAITANFNNLPDAPATDIQIDLNGPPRAGINGPLPGNVLAIAAANECQPTNELTSSLVSSAQTLPGTPVNAARVSTINFTGCNEPVEHITGPTVGQNITTATAPSFSFEPTGTLCGINAYASGAVACTSPFTPGVQTRGVKRIFVGSDPDVSDVSRAFAVNPAIVTPESTAPTTTIDSGPSGVTADTTPSFTFSGADNVTAPGSLKFQCSVDASAFLPCPGTNDYTYGDLDADATTVHTLEVRAVDAAGNTDLSPASRSFTVDVPFSATMTTSVSDTTARAHPSYDLTVQTPSHDDLKAVTLKLPDGFFGGLTGVTELCTLVDADAGNCSSGSQAGTVTTTATVDQSTVVISGQVYLTKPREDGQPASLSIKIPAKVGGVDMGNVIVTGLLKVRDHAKGIDSTVISIPNSITKFNTSLAQNETINFDTRKLQLHLESNPAASQPLLVNPSYCGAASFDGEFTSYGAATSTSSYPFQVTGCDALGFGPSLSANVVDTTTGAPPGNSSSSKSVSATLSATLTANPDDAGITSTSILLPKPLTINVTKIPPVCEQIQFDTDTCPSSSAVGAASAVSPLLVEPLSGTIYLLRAIPPLVTPRLAIELRGPINTNIVAVNSFEPGTGTQIRTTITDLPDVPISSFSLQIANVVSTINTACDTPPAAWSMTGAFNGFNGKSAPVAAPLEFGCNTVAFSKINKKWRGKKSTLSFNAKAQGKLLPWSKFKFALPKGVTLLKKGLAKNLIVKADGKKLKAKCLKAKGSNTIEINFCKKSASTLTVQFKAGSLNAKKKIKKPKLTVITTDTARKTAKYIPAL